MKQFIFLFVLIWGVFAFAQGNPKAKNAPIEVYERVDRDAAFPGGMNNFRAIFSQRFNANKVNSNDRLIKTVVTFIVERDGTITDVKAVGVNSSFNWEAINTIKKIKIKWRPAMLRKQMVRQRFKLPLTMNFE